MDFCKKAMEIATGLGVQYADIRLQKTTSRHLWLRNLSFKNTAQGISHGYGVRVLVEGAWGFAHNSIFTKEALEATVRSAVQTARLSATIKKGEGLVLAPERSYIATHRTPFVIDPFSISTAEMGELMLEVNRRILLHSQIRQASFMMVAHKDEKLFASTLGTELDIATTHVCPMISAVAADDHDSQTRSFNEGGHACGWEWVLQQDFLQQADRLAEEAVIKLKAATLTEDRKLDLILDPIHLGLTMHESVGHPTELDRVLGWEADFAGVSFATPEKLGNYRYASPLVNFVGDNTLTDGLATAGFDDDGVPGQKWYIIKDGILNEYGTTRDTAPFIGLGYSRGCNRATNYYDQPINRIPNLYMEAGKKELTPAQLIGDTEDGVFIQGQGSFSIDQHRVSFQFGGDFFYEIKNGKLSRPLKKVLYRSHNPEFWSSCDAICDQRFWRSFGVINCGKGQPGQSGRMTHGAAPARFRQIMTGGSK